MIESWNEYKFFEDELRKFVENVDASPKIKNALKYIVEAGGKRVRPLIVLITGKMFGSDLNKLLNLAFAVEFIHTASLIHDDIIDRAERRRSRITLHKKYNLPLALLLGDWLISKSVELTSIYGEEIIGEFARAGMRMCEGEILDVYSKAEKINEKEYFECIEKKTAALFAYSAKNSCYIACKNKDYADKMFEYGLNLGLAYQIVDDLLEYTNTLKDKVAGEESRTILHIYEENFGKKDAIKKVLEIIEKHSKVSKRALSGFKDSEERRKLEYVVDFMTFELLKRSLPELFE
ncbi:MAG: polyprenyl synthetase family protein [Archaeoglobaceae archaeon]|nr:polyprenyl synthetase family protein [Archaeoglobaceae archaeon]MCX8151982.1 polyprenyl synthetase family protein [Archaeoglobaceae archaeon]MDW8013371.1 polyprenyl synthetase family protein [Archaeoglobaceae archaeon]